MLSSLKASSSILECAGRCSAVRTVSFDEFRDKVRGTTYRELIEYHLRSHPPEEVRQALREVLGVLPEEGTAVASELASRWSERLSDGEIWERDCAEVAEEIAGEARRRLEDRDAPADQDVLFDLFEVVTLNYARAAHEHESVRRAMGVRRHGWLGRNGWYLAGAVACLVGAAAVDGLWPQALFAGSAGALLLPPLARWVDGLSGGRS
jgi:hypothetical protein